MDNLSPSTNKLIEEFTKLPSIGMKTAQRLAYFLLNNPPQHAHNLANAIIEARDRIRYCSHCFILSENDPCTICSNASRDQTIICVVEKSLDALAIEKTGTYQGAYHVLHGVLNPLEGIGSKDLRIAELLHRVKSETVREVILATNPTTQGVYTFHYLSDILKALSVQVTALARGLPNGSEVEYADPGTLSRALEERRSVSET